MSVGVEVILKNILKNGPNWVHFDLILVQKTTFDFFFLFFSELSMRFAFLTHPAKG